MEVRWHYGCSIPYSQKRILKMFQKIKATYVSGLCLTSRSHHSPHMQIKDFFLKMTRFGWCPSIRIKFEKLEYLTCLWDRISSLGSKCMVIPWTIEVRKLPPTGQIQTAICFSIAQELRMVFTFLKSCFIFLKRHASDTVSTKPKIFTIWAFTGICQPLNCKD